MLQYHGPLAIAAADAAHGRPCRAMGHGMQQCSVQISDLQLCDVHKPDLQLGGMHTVDV